MKYFSKSEFRLWNDDEKLLTMLDQLREVYGNPIKITSSYRSPSHPIRSNDSPGEHAMEQLLILKVSEN